MATRKTWQRRALDATSGTRFGAILHAALQESKAPPCFDARAIVTSDGLVMAGFTDSSGIHHCGAFAGSLADLESKCDGLSRHLSLDAIDNTALRAVFDSWIIRDYRNGKGVA